MCFIQNWQGIEKTTHNPFPNISSGSYYHGALGVFRIEPENYDTKATQLGMCEEFWPGNYAAIFEVDDWASAGERASEQGARFSSHAFIQGLTAQREVLPENGM